MSLTVASIRPLPLRNYGSVGVPMSVVTPPSSVICPPGTAAAPGMRTPISTPMQGYREQLPTGVVSIPAERFGFQLNSQVTWKEEDDDIPRGTVGVIIGFPGDDRVRVKFPRDYWDLHKDEIVKVGVGYQAPAQQCIVVPPQGVLFPPTATSTPPPSTVEYIMELSGASALLENAKAASKSKRDEGKHPLDDHKAPKGEHADVAQPKKEHEKNKETPKAEHEKNSKPTETEHAAFATTLP